MIKINKLSFKDARENFARNLDAILKALNYSNTVFCMKLNELSKKSIIAHSSDVKDWLENTKIPSVYQLYKISVLFKTSIDELFSSNLDISSVKGKSFALQSLQSPKELITSINENTKINTHKTTTVVNKNNSKENLIMSSRTNSTISITRSQKKNMESVVFERTDFRKTVNLLLAYRIYNSDMTLAEIAKKVGVSTRSLRDYSFQDSSLSETTANRLSKILGASFRQLGLVFNEETGRYQRADVKITA